MASLQKQINELKLRMLQIELALKDVGEILVRLGDFLMELKNDHANEEQGYLQAPDLEGATDLDNEEDAYDEYEEMDRVLDLLNEMRRRYREDDSPDHNNK